MEITEEQFDKLMAAHVELADRVDALERLADFAAPNNPPRHGPDSPFAPKVGDAVYATRDAVFVAGVRIEEGELYVVKAVDHQDETLQLNETDNAWWPWSYFRKGVITVTLGQGMRDLMAQAAEAGAAYEDEVDGEAIVDELMGKRPVNDPLYDLLATSDDLPPRPYRQGDIVRIQPFTPSPGRNPTTIVVGSLAEVMEDESDRNAVLIEAFMAGSDHLYPCEVHHDRLKLVHGAG